MISVLVCGGRDFDDKSLLFDVLDGINKARGIVLVIQGGARGADRLAAEWAVTAGVHSITFNANWDKYGKAAGPIRNKAMLEWEPDLIVAFPGGAGTANMVKQAKDGNYDVLHVYADGGTVYDMMKNDA